jgi:hypothetical protein
MHEVAAMELMAEMNQNQTLEGGVPSGSPISVADVRNLDVGSPIEFCLANPLAFSSIKVVIGEDYQIKFLPANFKFDVFSKEIKEFIRAMNEDLQIHHRDISETNIMIDLETGLPCLVVFGDAYKTFGERGMIHVKMELT